MSIYFDFDAGPKGRRFRRAVDQDKVDIETFWKPEETETLFSSDDIGRLIELSTLAICMIDSNLDVTGFMALTDHPRLPALHPAAWEIWIRNMFQKYYLSRNTLFITFMCCKDEVSEYFMEEALVSVFMNDFYLRQIILVVPSTCKIDCIAKYPAFKKRNIYRKCSKDQSVESCYALFVAMRNDFCSKLKVRRAVEEDNDDVVRILDSQCKVLRELYGDFYVSEILSRHPESKRTIIVAEQNSSVVGVMCLSADINYAKLQSVYELAPYHGLVLMDGKSQEKSKRANLLLKTYGDPIMKGERSPFETLRKAKDIGDQSKDPKKESKRKSKVNFRNKRTNYKPQFDPDNMNARDSNVVMQNRYESNDSDRTISIAFAQDISLMFLLDDEPLDYEIVNIDKNLFTVAHGSSLDENLSRSIHISFSTSGHRIRRARKKSNRPDLDDTHPLFEGTPNAFMIELFGLQNDKVDDGKGYDLLEAAFECMPDYEYCIIRVPSALKTFSLLHHFCVVPSKPNVCCRYALYIAHRNSVLGRLRVRKAELIDIPQITMLLNNLEGKETIWTIEQSIERVHEQQAYVFLSGYSIVGIGILDLPEHTDLVRAKFLIETFQNTRYHIAGQGSGAGVAMLKTAVVYPCFEPHYSFFAREMMRFSGATSLLWLTAYRNKCVAHKANGIVTAMTPLPYRVCAETSVFPDLKQVFNLSKHILSFSAWYVSKKLTSIPKLNVDTRIVVVGASRTAISFLYNLIFGDSSTYLTFTNVTLISTRGLPYLKQPIPAAEQMFPRYHTASDRFLKSTPFTYYVNVVQATVVEINRNNKYIITEQGCRFYYDRLFLLIGKQHQHPVYVKALNKRQRDIRAGRIPMYVTVDDPRYKETIQEPPTEFITPENVFIVNNIYDANRALHYVKNSFWKYNEHEKIVVYGACLDAYCCMTALLEVEIPPEDIVFVEPFPPQDETKPRIPLFANHLVDQTINSFLAALKVKVYRGAYFKSWTLDEMDMVNAIDFISYHNMIRIECSTFFYYGKRYINPNAFVAINKCGLAYDGGILINHEFRTQDERIYAAGPATRYYKRYNGDDRLLKFYDSYEVGKTLAIQIRNELDSLMPAPKPKEPVNLFASNASGDGSDDAPYYDYRNMLPKFKEPMVWYCYLPGGLQYLEVRPPGPQVPHYYVKSMDYVGQILETFQSGYFKLRLSSLGKNVVEGITCLTPDKRNIEQFKYLYGHSATMLNNVHIRFAADGIKDLYTFFRMPWSLFLYNDQSQDLLQIIKHLKPKSEPNGKTLEERLRDINDQLVDAVENRQSLPEMREFDKNFEAITDFVMKWLADYELLMPMFVTNERMLEYTHDLEHHPAFKRSKKTIKKMLAMIA